MGYSCTQDASLALGNLWHFYFVEGNGGNVVTIRGKQYFYEHGREQGDGAVTGTVLMMLGGDYARKVGTFRIEPDGTVSRFAGSTARERKEINNTFRDMQARNPRLLQSWSYGRI